LEFPDQDALWACVAEGRPAERADVSESGIDLGRLLCDAASERKLPSDRDMEKLERKATIARLLYARYDYDWTPRKENGKAAAQTLVGAAALFLLDAACCSHRGRALKRLNAAYWLIESADWRGDSPAAVRVAAAAESIARRLTDCPRP